MGERGPVPKRDAQRRRRNKPEVPATVAPAAPAEVVAMPPAAEGWHPIARRWYDALALSGQSRFYEPADWETAWMLAEAMSREFSPRPMVVGKGEHAHVEMVELPPSASALAAWRAMMAALLVTEGDRRRVRLELERPPAGAGGGAAGGGGAGGSVSWLDAARRSSG